MALVLTGLLAASAAAGTIFGTNGADTIAGTPQADTIYARDGNDSIDAAAGDDDIDGGRGADDIKGGAGDDTALYGGRKAAVAVSLDNAANDGESGEGDNVRPDVENLYAGSGSDTLVGSAGANTLDGAAGNDTIDGGAGRDQLFGGAGDDTIRSADGAADVVDCGEGTDSVTADSVDTVRGCERRAAAGRVKFTTEFRFRPGNDGATVLRLVVVGLTRGAQIEVRCRGGGCAFKTRKFPAGGSRATLTPLFKKRRLRVGATIDVRATAPGRIGLVKRFTVRRRSVFGPANLCLPVGSSKPQKRC